MATLEELLSDREPTVVEEHSASIELREDGALAIHDVIIPPGGFIGVSPDGQLGLVGIVTCGGHSAANCSLPAAA